MYGKSTKYTDEPGGTSRWPKGGKRSFKGLERMDEMKDFWNNIV